MHLAFLGAEEGTNLTKSDVLCVFTDPYDNIEPAGIASRVGLAESKRPFSRQDQHLLLQWAASCKYYHFYYCITKHIKHPISFVNEAIYYLNSYF